MYNSLLMYNKTSIIKYSYIRWLYYSGNFSICTIDNHPFVSENLGMKFINFVYGGKESKRTPSFDFNWSIYRYIFFLNKTAGPISCGRSLGGSLASPCKLNRAMHGRVQSLDTEACKKNHVLSQIPS